MLSDDDLRVLIYRTFATTGAAPTTDELERAAGGPAHDALSRLARDRHLVLGDDDRILMAHPFATIPLGFAVMGRDVLWWGGCAWDSFAMPHLIADEVLVATRCPGCDAPHVWVVGRDGPSEGGEVAHFLVPAARMWDDVVHTCGHQRLFCDEVCVDAWLAETRNAKGYVMDLATLWRLAAHWYDGRLDRGYTRRDPATAATYLRDVGLEGPFWGL
jgi:Alkylmercury lyase